MSTMIESLAQTRHAERYRASQRAAAGVAAAAGVPAVAGMAGATAAVRHDAADASRDGGALESTRSRAGWLLVGLGLRLALPGRQASPRRITLTGR